VGSDLAALPVALAWPLDRLDQVADVVDTVPSARRPRCSTATRPSASIAQQGL
jgi:hypothetical protein